MATEKGFRKRGEAKVIGIFSVGVDKGFTGFRRQATAGLGVNCRADTFGGRNKMTRKSLCNSKVKVMSPFVCNVQIKRNVPVSTISGISQANRVTFNLEVEDGDITV